MGRVLHIASEADWAKDAATYAHASLESEGFIHACGCPEDVLFVWDSFIKEPGSYLLVELDPANCSSEVKLDYVASLDRHFPHIYGAITKSEAKSAAPFHTRDELAALLK
ncbi:hypothetical protein DIPPA_02760 [Diplonema papillatum]|nr:hypothetical protein DIPPA_02760 [Diplonema papillatum]